jgi:hypothetical protein
VKSSGRGEKRQSACRRRRGRARRPAVARGRCRASGAGETSRGNRPDRRSHFQPIGQRWRGGWVGPRRRGGRVGKRRRGGRVWRRRWSRWSSRRAVRRRCGGPWLRAVGWSRTSGGEKSWEKIRFQVGPTPLRAVLCRPGSHA